MRKDWPNCCLKPVFCFGTMYFPTVACWSKIGCRPRKCIFDSEKHQYTQKDEIDIMSRNVKQHAFACCCWNVYVINILETKYHWLYFSVSPHWFPFPWINSLNWSTHSINSKFGTLKTHFQQQLHCFFIVHNLTIRSLVPSSQSRHTINTSTSLT